MHGELTKLKDVIEQVNLRDDDTLVFLGDYIDRGLDSCGVVDYIIKLSESYKVITLKGNHEMLLSESKAFIEGKLSLEPMVASWVMNGGYQCIDSYSRRYIPTKGLSDEELKFELGQVSIVDSIDMIYGRHGDFFDNLQLTYETDEYIFVHGYLDHELPSNKQNEMSCLWNRFDQIKPHMSGKRVVCGHTIQRDGPRENDHAICIDTGSFLSNGYITAMIIDGDTITYKSSKL